MSDRRLGSDGRSRASCAPRPSLDPEAAALLEHLIAWRRERAARDEAPAHLIAHNSVLAAIAASRPTDQSALAAIKGMGPAKIEKYGAEISAIVSAAAG